MIGEIFAIMITGLISSVLAVIAGDDISSTLLVRIVAAILSSIWIGFWFWHRRMPKGDKKKIVMVVSISSQKDKKKIDLINDFKLKIEELLLRESLGDIIELIVLPEYYSDRAVPLLRKYMATKSAKIVNNVNKLIKETNGRFFIFGEVKDRLEGVEKCFLDIDALLIHPSNQAVEKGIKDGFANLWLRKISFEKNWEFKGFHFTAEIVFHATRYVVGMAALAFGNIETALKLHNSLYKDFSKINLDLIKPRRPTNIIHITEKLKSLLTEENFILAYRCYESGNFSEAERYLNQSLQMGKSYAGFLLQSNLELSYKQNPKSALESVKKAQALANGDGTWRYNKAFLLMYREKFSEALKHYRQIAKSKTYNGEERILLEVYDFNQKFVQNNPDKIWSYFILGYLKWKRSHSNTDAERFFRNFLDAAEGKMQYQDLVNESESFYINEIDANQSQVRK